MHGVRAETVADLGLSLTRASSPNEVPAFRTFTNKFDFFGELFFGKVFR